MKVWGFLIKVFTWLSGGLLNRSPFIKKCPLRRTSTKAHSYEAESIFPAFSEVRLLFKDMMTEKDFWTEESLCMSVRDAFILI